MTVSSPERTYWSHRQGRGPKGQPTLADVYRAVSRVIDEFWRRDFFQEWFGYGCVDAGDVDGRARMDMPSHVELVLGYEDLLPLEPDRVSEAASGPPLDLLMAEDRVFDLIEYLHDHISMGVEEAGGYHSYSQCGWHYNEFDRESAQSVLRQRVNPVLQRYASGYRLSEVGEIQSIAPEGLDQLLNTPLRTSEAEIQARVASAIATYRSRRMTIEDQRNAVRSLFDVLEKLRPSVKAEMMTGDERDLFNMANNFTIRHYSESQRGDYDSPLWFSWMFYVNLATIHLILRLSQRAQHSTQAPA